MPKRTTKNRTRRDKTVTLPLPKGISDSVRVKMKHSFSIGVSGSGVVQASNTLGGFIVSLGDFANFSTVYSRWAVMTARIHIFPWKYSAATQITQLHIGYLNDGTVSAPASADAVLALKVSSAVNPLLTSPTGYILSANPKATLDPWVSTTTYTAAQLLQWGGWQYYSTGNTNSIQAWGIVLECDVVFTDKT